MTSTEDGGNLTPGASGTDIGHHLQTVGAEVGVTTGRKRRCGWLDIPVLQYSMLLNNYSAINITKLDVMDGLKTIKICTGYMLDGVLLKPGQMPSTLAGLGAVKPVYEEMPGWQQSLSTCRHCMYRNFSFVSNSIESLIIIFFVKRE
ncbi:MAG: adenylosuccinate synthetase [archaeon]|nr:adenylosuccinate synthetase [archaeon]